MKTVEKYIYSFLLVFLFLLLRRSLTGAFNFYFFISIFFSLTALTYYLAFYKSFSGFEILAIGVIIRLPFVTEDSILSNDFQRYLWDGMVFLRGYHPWSHTPASIAGDLDILSFLPRDHRDIQSLYPWTSLFYFSVLSIFASTKVLFSMMGLVLDVLTFLLLKKIFRAQKLSISKSILYFWSPLIIIENIYSAHVDGLGIYLMCFFLFTFICQNRFSRWFFVLMAHVKLWPILFATVFIPIKKYRLKTLQACLFFTIGFSTLLYFGVDGLFQYSTRWEFQNPLYLFLKFLFGSPQSRVVLLVLLFLVLTLVGYRIYQERISFLEGMLWVVSSFLVFSPTLYPWYTVWLLPLLMLRWNTGMFIFAHLSVLSYEVVPKYISLGVWEPKLWPSIFMLFPLVILAFDFRSLINSNRIIA